MPYDKNNPASRSTYSTRRNDEKPGRRGPAANRYEDRGTRRTSGGGRKAVRPSSGNEYKPEPRKGRFTEENRPVRKDYREYEYSGSSRDIATETKPSMAANDTEQYILTGRNPIREALKNHRDLEKLLVQKGELSGSAREIVQKAKEQKVLVQVVEKSRLDEIAPHHQGLIAFASAYQYSTVEEILASARDKGEDPFVILLDGITDPHNLGAIMRTAECAGVHGIIVPQHHSAGLSPAAIKASAGAVEYVKVARVTNLSRTLEMLRNENIWAYAVTMNGTDYRKTDFRGGVALVIGAEEDGISRLVLEKCDYAVSLPMTGKIESLNASVAAGIVMYRVLEGRLQD